VQAGQRVQACLDRQPVPQGATHVDSDKSVQCISTQITDNKSVSDFHECKYAPIGIYPAAHFKVPSIKMIAFSSIEFDANLTGAFVGINFCIVKNGSSVTRL
jgi:hypothetical protein